jgi:hypothetical protein
MIKLITALLTLVVGTAIATTAVAQSGWWVGCNPEAPACRLYNGSDDVRGQWAPGYVAPTHHRSMYMYAPRHRSGTHAHRTNGVY